MKKGSVIFALLCLMPALGVMTAYTQERDYPVRSVRDFTRAVAAINASRDAGTYRRTLAAGIMAGEVVFAGTEKTIVVRGGASPYVYQERQRNYRR
jgi:hypothetical protein